MCVAILTQRVRVTVAAALITVVTASSRAQTQCNRPGGPDVIVGDLPDVTSYGSVGNISSFAVGTTSCNVGDQNLLWIAPTNQHPVIAQNMYRLKNGRFEQIGMSWLKHGFLALTGNFCQCGCNGQGGTVLGVGCSDPYSSGLNGFQGSAGTGGLGPRFEVNPHTGDFQFPYTFLGMTGDAIYKRLQVHNFDLDPAQDGGGLYFVEGHYVTPDDAAVGNQNNNASYRKVRVSSLVGTWTISIEDTTRQEQAAIRAWQNNDPTVSETDVHVPNDGLFIVAANATPLPNGLYRYEYAVYNMNSDRSARSFSVPIVAGASITNLYFHDVDYHSGDGIGGVNYDGTDWTASVNSSSVTWSTETFAQNESANALRWGTLYNFAFEADLVPNTNPAPATIGLFKPAAPTEVDALTMVPSNDIVGVTIVLSDGVPSFLPPNVLESFDVRIIPVNETVVAGSPTLHYRYDGGVFLTKPLSLLGGQLYQATLPPAECDAVPEFYLSAAGDGGSTTTSPLGAPANVHSAVMGDLIFELADDFETDQGWTVENVDIITGAWERGVPAGGGDLRDPPTDFDGSGQCYVTGIMDGDFDLDGGPTRLLSPILDLSEALDPTLEFARWYNSSGFGDDPLFVDISNDGGTTWTSVVGVFFGTNWAFLSFRIADFVTPNGQVRVRFTVQDNPDNSITEVGIDAVVVRDFRCVPICIKCDVDNDFAVDGRDIDRFLQILVGGGGTSQEICAGDLHVPTDGVIDMNDVDDFVACLLSI